MSDDYRHIAEDGSGYSIDLHVPEDTEKEAYRVELVQHIPQDDENQEQRHILAQYNSYGEAEEHFYEAENQLKASGLADFDLPEDAPTVLAVVYPSDAEGQDVAAAHLLTFDETGFEQEQLAQGDAEAIKDLVAQVDLQLHHSGADVLLEERAHAREEEVAYERTHDNRIVRDADEAQSDPFLDADTEEMPTPLVDENDLNEPSYSVGGISANGESFLDVMKTWGEDDYERLVIPQPNWELTREAATFANDLLDAGELEAAMRLVEDQGVSAGVIDPERDDPRLFTQGPPDPFTTLREEDLAAEQAVILPYWRMETLPVNNPDGEPLGHSLHMVVYDGVEHDPEMVGTPAIPDNEPFRMLEMAHFETTEAADKFGVEFDRYLMPGLLEGPKLAEEVPRLEGHPVEWKTLEGQELDDYRDLKLTLTRDPADWQPYNPNAERDARIEAEGEYKDPIYRHLLVEVLGDSEIEM